MKIEKIRERKLFLVNFHKKSDRQIVLKPLVNPFVKVNRFGSSESKWRRGLKRKKKYIRETFGNDYSPCPLRFPITSYVMRIDNTSGNSFTSETERRDG